MTQTYNKLPMPMLSVECTAFRLTEIMSKRTVVSAENAFVLSTSVLNWLYVESS